MALDHHSTEPTPAHATARRWIVAFALAGFALRVGLTIAAWPTAGDAIRDDALEYQLLATNLARHGRFSKSVAEPYRPHTLRTPAYPLALTPFVGPLEQDQPGPVYIVQALAQMALYGWLCLALLAWGAGPFVAASAMFILAFEPAQVIAPNQLLTDLAFTLIFWIAVLVAVNSRRAPLTVSRSFACGLIWGVAALTRPIGLFWMILSLVWVLFANRAPESGGGARRLISRSRLIAGAVLLAGFALIVVPWMMRNRTATGRLMVSEISSVNLYYYRAAGIEARLTGDSFAEVQTRLGEKESERFAGETPWGWEKAAFHREQALPIISGHPIIAARMTAAGLARMMLGRTSPEFAESLGIEYRGLRAGLTDRRGWRDWAVLAVTIVDYAWIFLSLVLGLIGFFMIRRWNLAPGAKPMLIAVVLYFTLISAGPEAYSRFRLPFAPAWAVFAAFGLDSLVAQLQARHVRSKRSIAG